MQPSIDENVSNDQDLKTVKRRNYSFLHRNQEGLDSVVAWDNQEITIPATPGTWYWAIIKYCYENHDRALELDDVIDGATEIYSGRDPEKFEAYKAKSKIKTRKNGEPIEREANSWRDRIETNIKTLTRHGGSNPYGERLRERGHILRWEPNLLSKGAFVLRTDTNEPYRISNPNGKKSRQKSKKN